MPIRKPVKFFCGVDTNFIFAEERALSNASIEHGATANRALHIARFHLVSTLVNGDEINPCAVHVIPAFYSILNRPLLGVDATGAVVPEASRDVVLVEAGSQLDLILWRRVEPRTDKL